MKKTIVILLAVVSAIISQNRRALAAPGDITVTATINHGSAYRDGFWAPVEVTVVNDAKDFKGWIEVIFENNLGYIQSPVYRQSIESARSSKKVFQLTCRIKGSSKMAIRLLDQRDNEVVQPFVMDIASIRNEDYLILALDDNPAGYDFMRTALQSGDKPVRVYIERLTSNTIGSFSEHSQCYRQADAIVMGDIDPSRLDDVRRDTIRDYIRNGGKLVVFTGGNWKRYRGTWVEELLGADVGEAVAITDSEALNALVPQTIDGTVAPFGDERKIMAASLLPKAQYLNIKGDGRIVATYNRIGNGAAVALMLDESGFGGRLSEPMMKVVAEAIGKRQEKAPQLDYDQLGGWLNMVMPRMVGISSISRWQAARFLGLYVAIGFIGSWLVFNRLKRRELAFVSMGVFSVGFTAYAAVFGTSGLSKKVMTHEIKVIELPSEGNDGKLTTIAGLFSTRSSLFDVPIGDAGALVQDVERYVSNYYGNPRNQNNEPPERPFYLVEDEQTRIERMSVRASEIKTYMIESDSTLPGRIEGELTVDDTGVRGELKNNTGMKFDRVHLLVSGKVYELPSVGEVWKVDINFSSRPERLVYGQWDYNFDWDRFGDGVMSKLFPTISNNNYGEQMFDFKIAPQIFAWKGTGFNKSQTYRNNPISVSGTSPAKIDVTVLIEEIPIKDSDTGSSLPMFPVVTVPSTYSVFMSPISPDQCSCNGKSVNRGQTLEMEIFNVMEGSDVADELTLDVYWNESMKSTPEAERKLELTCADNKITIEPEEARMERVGKDDYRVVRYSIGKMTSCKVGPNGGLEAMLLPDVSETNPTAYTTRNLLFIEGKTKTRQVFGRNMKMEGWRLWR